MDGLARRTFAVASVFSESQKQEVAWIRLRGGQAVGQAGQDLTSAWTEGFPEAEQALVLRKAPLLNLGKALRGA